MSSRTFIEYAKKRTGLGILGRAINGLITGAMLLGAARGHAQTNLLGWGGYNSATTTFPMAAASHVASISSATLSYYQTFRLNDSRGVWGAANQSTTLDVTTAPYIDWTINFNPGVAVTNAIFYLNLAKLDTPTKLQLSYSIDNYATSLGSLSAVNTSYQNFMFTLGSTPLSGTVDFRLYFYDVSSLYATNSTYNNVYNVGCLSSYSTIGGTYNAAMNNYTAGLLGNITAIPEPTSFALAGLALAILFVRRRNS